MENYQITITTEERKNEAWAIEATSIEDAAEQAVRRVCQSRSKFIHTERVTGVAGKSGIFQCYKSIKNGWMSIGPNYHVW